MILLDKRNQVLKIVDVYPLLLTPQKDAGGRAITFRRLDWAPDDLVETSRWADVRKTRARQDLLLQTSEITYLPRLPGISLRL